MDLNISVNQWSSIQRTYKTSPETTNPISIPDLIRICNGSSTLQEEIRRFISYYISFGEFTNIRTGFPISTSKQIFFKDFAWERFRASQFSMSNTLSLLEEHGFPEEFERAVVEEVITGYRFIHLLENTSELRLRLLSVLKERSGGGEVSEAMRQLRSGSITN